MKHTPNEQLVRILRTVPKVSLQNRLLRTADRELALSMMFMEEQDRDVIYGLLSAKKAHRVKEEVQFHDRLRISYDQYKTVVEQVIVTLTRDQVTSGRRSYLRPIR